MSVSGGLGISPVLLQAVSLQSRDSGLGAEKGRVKHAIPRMDQQQQQQQQQQLHPSSKVVSHLLQGMNEPVSGLLAMSTPVTDLDQAPSGQRQEEMILNATLQDRLASHMVNQGQPGGSPSSAADVSMVNVLTALATQHIRANIKREAEAGHSADSAHLTDERRQPAPSDAMIRHAAEVLVQTNQRDSGDSADNRPQPHIIIYYNNDPVPSPGNNVTIGEAGEGSVQNYRIVMNSGDASAGQVTTLAEPTTVQMVTEVDVATVAGMCESQQPLLIPDAAGMTPQQVLEGFCPICGDRLSGYHYGVFSCESCKGFFKRTVQNAKQFQCHKQGQCEINMYNRKKCPACRFEKCKEAGMKVAAIRQDRTRGGRSSYEGCSPHGKTRMTPLPRKLKRPSSDSKADMADVDLLAGGEEEAKGHRQLVAILNHSNKQQAQDGKGQRVPELLTDIMNLEALLVEDDFQDNPGDDPNSEAAFYTYLMQLTELRLYKLVRWARNLPQFGAISTDDQIILLQNCWSDLLALGVCWRSVENPAMLSISATRSITLKQAQGLGFGDVVDRLLSITQSLRSLKVDQYEYVALKVLLLITPDVKGLKEPGKIREYQEKLSEALLEYTSSHYVYLPSKFGQMLLRLPELARISFLAKEILLTALPPSSPQCGLLVELLKGENAVKD